MVCWWLFGAMVVTLMVLFSTVAKSNNGVLLGAGGVVLASYLVGLLPKCSKYLPTFLTDGNSLIYSLVETMTYMPSLMIAMATGVMVDTNQDTPVVVKRTVLIRHVLQILQKLLCAFSELPILNVWNFHIGTLLKIISISRVL